MYEKIKIVLLLSGCISVQTAVISTPENEATYGVTPSLANALRKSHLTPKMTQEVSVPLDHPHSPGQEGARQQIEHIFSEPVIIGIIYGVMAGTVGIILSISYCAHLLRKKSAFNVQPTESVDAGDPLSSVETENPEV
ncbi:Glycophorin-A [Manis javanica]|nr:Glycophorin-A [Manis javanica]